MISSARRNGVVGVFRWSKLGQAEPDSRYFRDPRGALSETLQASFLADAHLPDDAAETS